MEYKFLGKSGLQVSSICINIITNSASPRQASFENTLTACIDKGINYFLLDFSSEFKKDGKGDNINVGDSIKNLHLERQSLVLATVLETGNVAAHSRKRLIELTTEFLKGNSLEYLDILYCKRSEGSVTLEELCKSMHWLIEKCHAFYWGTSGWSADDIVEEMEICESLNLHK